MISLINGCHDHPNYLDISGLSCGMNVTSTTAVSCSVTTSSSVSLPNDGEDGEKSNLPKSRLFLKCNDGKISVKCAGFYSTQQKWYL